MDTCSSGEDLTIKARKPYIITKQRERWTEEEHTRFLEAIKLYGRAWQRIEEHIGTKTAVQIRSHAQKFFTKLEKEALVKGIPAGQALDIEIPPPRPKRKPSNPFPRKTAVGPLSADLETIGGKLQPSVIPGRQILNIDKEPLPEKPHGKENQGGDDCSSGIVNFGEEMHNSSIIISNENCIPIPVDQNNNTSVAFEAEAKQEAVPVRLNLNHKPTNNITDSANSYPLPGQEKNHHSNILHDNDRDTNPAATCTPFPAFHPFFSPPVCHNQDDFRSFFNMPTFWNLIISALLQNPAAHRAATLAATLWPIDNLETSPLDHPSMQAIVATTLAAATAWWAAHGLIPSCSPFTNSGAKPDTNNNHDKAASDVVEVKDRKLVDHSSCGSNASSSEIEIDALDKEVLPKEDNVESFNRRCKNPSIITDSWKEVSEEGRVAFQALFSRQVLPQSFSYPPLDNIEYALRLGLNSTPVVQDSMTTTNNSTGKVNNGDQESMLDLELGLNLTKLNNKAGRRTGFKPYKRCCSSSSTVEAKEMTRMMMVNSNGGGQVGEKTPKRICLEQKVLS